MPDAVPMIMFCGLPVRVAAEPMFEAVARAMRYGSGLRRAPWAICTTSGVNIRQMVSFRNNALSSPARPISTANKMRGERAVFNSPRPASWKNPAICKFAFRIIIENSRISVSRSKKSPNAEKATCRVAMSSPAPISVIVVRLARSPGQRPTAIPIYVTVTIINVIQKSIQPALQSLDSTPNLRACAKAVIEEW